MSGPQRAICPRMRSRVPGRRMRSYGGSTNRRSTGRGARASAEELREKLRAELSAYKVPRHLYFYDEAELPFTDSGKIDKQGVARLLAARARSSRE